MKKMGLLVGLVLLLTNALAWAQENPSPESQAVVAPDISSFPVLEKLRGNDKKLTYDYLGKSGHLEAWLLSGPGLMQVVYALPDDHALVGGAVIGPDAKEIGPELLQEFMKRSPERAQAILATAQTKRDAPQPENAAPPEAKAETPPPPAASESPSEVLWRELGQTGYISYGNRADAPVVYAILDPAQSESKAVWQELSPLAKSNQIILHVIPLALMTGDSVMDIASVLGGDNPQGLWDKLMAGQSVQEGNPPNGEKILAIENTVKLAQKLQLRSLPFLVYRLNIKGDAGKVRIIRGVPKNWAGFKAELVPATEKP